MLDARCWMADGNEKSRRGEKRGRATWSPRAVSNWIYSRPLSELTVNAARSLTGAAQAASPLPRSRREENDDVSPQAPIRPSDIECLRRARAGVDDSIRARHSSIAKAGQKRIHVE